MIPLKFPKLETALTKDVKNLPENDCRKGILVIENTAIVFHDLFCLCVNLYDYFTIECGIEDPDEVNELKRILNYFDDKMISKEFWKELTMGANISINEGNLLVENPKYTKDLSYKITNFDWVEPLSMLDKVQKNLENPVSCIALPFLALNNIYNTLKTDFKNDQIIFEISSQDKPVKFTFRARKHFYGYINSHYDAAQEGFRFDLLETFNKNLSSFFKNKKDERKSQMAPPPPLPPIDDSEPKEDSAQMKLVE